MYTVYIYICTYVGSLCSLSARAAANVCALIVCSFLPFCGLTKNTGKTINVIFLFYHFGSYTRSSVCFEAIFLQCPTTNNMHALQMTHT